MRCHARPILLFIALSPLAIFAGVIASAGEPPQGGVDPARVAEIRKVISDKPMGFGRPVSDREAWGKLADVEPFKSAASRAEKYLKDPVVAMPKEAYLQFVEKGSSAMHGRIAKERYRRITNLTLAEAMENKGRFIPPLEAIIRDLCTDVMWVSPYHDRKLDTYEGRTTNIDLHTGMLSWILGTSYYILGEKMSPEVKALLLENEEKRAWGPLRAMVRGDRGKNWWLTGTNNWNAVCLGGVVGSHLAMVESKDDRAFMVAVGEKYIQNFLAGFPPDGYCTEGVGYWNYGFSHFLGLAEAIWQSTDGQVDLFRLERAPQAATFGARFEISDGVYPAFADCSVGSKPNAKIMWFASRRYGMGLKFWEKQGRLPGFGSLYFRAMYSFPTSADDVPPADKPMDTAGLRSWFPDGGILLGRPKPHSEAAMGVALKGGHNAEHHNHNDVGGFVCVVSGESLVIDPGAEFYGEFTFSSRRYESNVMNSFGHSVPVVAGKLQRPGRQAAAKVLRTDFSDDADTLALDLKACYDVPELEQLERTFVYSRQARGRLTVTDDIKYMSPEAFETAILTFADFEKDGANAFRLIGSMVGLRAQVDTGGVPFEITTSKVEGRYRTGKLPTRIAIRIEEPVAKARVAVTFEPAKIKGLDPGPGLVPNGGFEAGERGWDVGRNDMGKVTSDQAASGKMSLHVRDTDPGQSSNINSPFFPLKPKTKYIVRGKYYPVSGKGMGFFIRQYDEHRRFLQEMCPGQEGGETKQWKEFAYPFETREDTAWGKVQVHAMIKAVVEGYVDDLEVVEAGE